MMCRKMYSKVYFPQVRPSTCGRQHRGEMFYQMLKYRYNEYRMFLYIERKYEDLWISKNVSDIFTMAP